MSSHPPIPAGPMSFSTERGARDEASGVEVARERSAPGHRSRLIVPLHRGFGYGAGEVIEKSLRVARDADARRRRDVEAAVTTTLPHFSPGRLSDTPHTRLSDAQHTRLSDALPEKTIARPQSLRPEPRKSAPLPRLQTPTSGTAFFAAFLDVCVTGGLAVVSLVIHGIGDFATHPAARALGRFLAGQSALQRWNLSQEILVQASQVALLAAGFVLIVQCAAGLFLGASLGRYSMSIELAPRDRSSFSGLLVGFAELVSLGGVLTLPLCVLMPGRVPLFPWLRLVTPVPISSSNARKG